LIDVRTFNRTLWLDGISRPPLGNRPDVLVVLPEKRPEMPGQEQPVHDPAQEPKGSVQLSEMLTAEMR